MAHYHLVSYHDTLLYFDEGSRQLRDGGANRITQARTRSV